MFINIYLVGYLKKGDGMNNKIFVLLLFAFAFAFAIQPAESWTVGQIGKYTQVLNANVTTEGGNVTELNLSSNISTERWAGFWGNVSGQIVLAPNTTAIFYTWTWNSSNGGEVCAVAASSGFNWASLSAVANTVIDSVWGFGAATDNATKTFNETCASITINNQTVSSTAGSLTGQRVDFKTCAIADSGSPTAKSDIAFCVPIKNAGNLFNGQTGDYELIAPTDAGPTATETYYFWLELD